MAQYDGCAVAGDFHHVLRRVGVRLAKTGNHNLVQNAARIRLAQFAHGGALRLKLGLPQTHKTHGNFHRPLTGQTHNSDAAPPRRRSDGDDSVFGSQRPDAVHGMLTLQVLSWPGEVKISVSQIGAPAAKSSGGSSHNIASDGPQESYTVGLKVAAP